MLYLLQSSQGQVPVWVAIVGPVLSATGTWLTLLLTRKKPSQVQAENDRAAAEVRSLDIQSMAELAQQVRDTRAELAEIVRDGNEKAQEHRRTASFLREQVRWHEELSILARQAAHTAINEIQRCVWAIQLRDDALKEADVDTTEIPEFKPMNYEEITNYQSLPMPPKRINP